MDRESQYKRTMYHRLSIFYMLTAWTLAGYLLYGYMYAPKEAKQHLNDDDVSACNMKKSAAFINICISFSDSDRHVLGDEGD